MLPLRVAPPKNLSKEAKRAFEYEIRKYNASNLLNSPHSPLRRRRTDASQHTIQQVPGALLVTHNQQREGWKYELLYKPDDVSGWISVVQETPTFSVRANIDDVISCKTRVWYDDRHPGSWSPVTVSVVEEGWSEDPYTSVNISQITIYRNHSFMFFRRVTDDGLGPAWYTAGMDNFVQRYALVSTTGLANNKVWFYPNHIPRPVTIGSVAIYVNQGGTDRGYMNVAIYSERVKVWEGTGQQLSSARTFYWDTGGVTVRNESIVAIRLYGYTTAPQLFQHEQGKRTGVHVIYYRNNLTSFPNNDPLSGAGTANPIFPAVLMRLDKYV